jgi:hypothetical protein
MNSEQLRSRIVVVCVVSKSMTLFENKFAWWGPSDPGLMQDKAGDKLQS